MGFLEKVKNMFTEEVEDDVKVEQIKKEVTHVSIESRNADEKNDKFNFVDKYVEEEKINKPVFFDDNDFKDLHFGSNEIKKEKVEPEKPVYGIKIEEPKKEEKKVFKPTPIISPVYGVLDKNYHKEDIVTRKESKSNRASVTNVSTSEPSIESIRNKAYGTLEDELENTLFGSNSILFKKDEPKEEREEIELDELDLTDDISKELDELLIKKETYEEEKSENIEDEDLLGFIDSTLYKEGDDE